MILHSLVTAPTKCKAESNTLTNPINTTVNPEYLCCPPGFTLLNCQPEIYVLSTDISLCY